MSYRAVSTWGRAAPSEEGGPAARETIYVIAMDMMVHDQWLEALATLLALDCYLREQDWDQLRGEDVFLHRRPDGPPEVALLLGRRHRGESVKTGQEQGVKIDDEFVARAMAARVGSIQGSDKVFPFNSEQFRSRWRQSQARLGLQWVGPPHTLRHSGPSCDATSGRRDLEQIRRRGRW